MPRRPPVYSDRFYRPLTEDVEELLARFQQTDSVRYAHFSAIWRSMSFSDLFAGIPTMGEMKRFCRVALATASKYFLGPFSYQIRVGGLYLLYGFYNTQLAVPQCKIRFALKDWHLIRTFLEESGRSQHHDVVYVLRRLLAARAPLFVAMPHLLTFCKRRVHRSEPLCAGFLGRTQRVQELVYSELLDEVSNVQTLYLSMKVAVVEKTGLVSMAAADLPDRLHAAAEEMVAWQDRHFPAESRGGEEEEEEQEEEQEESTKRAQLLSSIKRKSYGSYKEAGRARRHRQPVPMVETGSGTGTGERRRRRPPSLRARTWGALAVREEATSL
ncbi:unnamed protein product [Merluccius merluccius]